MKRLLTDFNEFLNEGTGHIPEELLKDPLMFTLSKMRRDQGITLVKPKKMNLRKRRGVYKETLIKRGEFHWVSQGNDGTWNVSYRIGPMLTSTSVENFFKEFKIKILEPEQIEDIQADPSQKDIKRVMKIGKRETEYYQGGFPSRSYLIYDDNNKSEKRILNSIKTRKDAIIFTKAVKSLFGTGYRTPYEKFIAKCHEVGCTPGEIKDIEDYDERIDTNRDLSIV